MIRKADNMGNLLPAKPKQAVTGQLETLLLEGLNSPVSELTPESWSGIRQEALAMLEARQYLR